MQITDVEAFTVAIPFRAPILSAFGVSYPARVRTFVRLHTDAGLVGIGETGPYAVLPFNRSALLSRFEETIRPAILGEDPFDYKWLQRKLFHSTDSVAIEMACWDIMAQAAGVPLYRLLGGQKRRDHVPIAGYCFFKAPGRNGADPITLDNFVEHAQDIQREGGFSTLKLKLGVHPPKQEIDMVVRLRETIGDDIELRIDPNGCWSVPTALRVIKQLEQVDLQYIEEPIRVRGPRDSTVDTGGLRRLREASRTPIAADHCYRLDLLAQIVHDSAADLVLADIPGSGGIGGTVRFCHVAAAFGLGIGMHSSAELGVGQMAKVHIAAAFPDEILYAGDAIYPEYVDDVLVGGKLEIKDGHMSVPQTPGLGVGLDTQRLARWKLTAERHRELDALWAEVKAAVGVGYPYADLLVRHY